MNIGNKIIELPSERMARLAEEVGRLTYMHREEQRARQNYETICRAYEKAQNLIANDIARIMSDTEEAGKTTLLWWAHILDHAEDASTLCRACFEQGETCDAFVAKARERIEERQPISASEYGMSRIADDAPRGGGQ